MLLRWVKSTEIVSRESALRPLGLFSGSTQGLHAVAMYVLGVIRGSRVAL